ncbi:MAG: ATP-binding protein [Propionibacteriaceae bacterium]|nr:ATP-binding protein [Propionibacteriaceae bacterium]
MKLRNDLGRGKAVILMGARQVGKTTVLHKLLDGTPGVLWLSGDDLDVRSLFDQATSTRLKTVIGQHHTLVLDEAQRIEDIGIKLKIITDQIPEIQVIATGSSSFELANKDNEPLTGRKFTHQMFPLSYEEMVNHHGLLEENRLLTHRLVFGYYPDVVTHPGSEKVILRELSDSYLFKDLLNWGIVKKTDSLVKLLQALAYQVGSQVSYPEIGNLCGLDYKTVDKYVTLLEQAHIVFRLSSFSRNLRNELKKSRKIYFVDNGIRNSLIANFAQFESRADFGALWENYLMSERRKAVHYHDIWANTWFWRTTQQSEIDLIEEVDGHLAAYEYKWNPSAKTKKHKLFLETYPGSQLRVIHRGNVEEFLLVPSP